MAADEEGTDQRVADMGDNFIGAESNDSQRSQEALYLTGQLYDIEGRARDPDERWALLEWRLTLREEEPRPILTKIYQWAEGQPMFPRRPIGKAIKYLKARWPRLTHFVDHPELWLDNNPTMRGIRGPVVSRKNHYGSRSRRGTEVAAMMYTIFETAKTCGVDPRDYIRRVVTNDSDTPQTVTLPEPIEEVMTKVDG